MKKLVRCFWGDVPVGELARHDDALWGFRFHEECPEPLRVFLMATFPSLGRPSLVQDVPHPFAHVVAVTDEGKDLNPSIPTDIAPWGFLVSEGGKESQYSWDSCGCDGERVVRFFDKDKNLVPLSQASTLVSQVPEQSISVLFAESVPGFRCLIPEFSRIGLDLTGTNNLLAGTPGGGALSLASVPDISTLCDIMEKPLYITKKQREILGAHEDEYLESSKCAMQGVFLRCMAHLLLGIEFAPGDFFFDVRDVDILPILAPGLLPAFWLYTKRTPSPMRITSTLSLDVEWTEKSGREAAQTALSLMTGIRSHWITPRRAFFVKPIVQATFCESDDDARLMLEQFAKQLEAGLKVNIASDRHSPTEKDFLKDVHMRLRGVLLGLSRKKRKKKCDRKTNDQTVDSSSAMRM